MSMISFLGARIEAHLEGSLISNIDKIASGHIKHLLVKVCAPVIKNMRSQPDYVEEYRNDYGYLGIALQSAVYKARIQPSTTTPATTSVPSSSITTVGATITRTVSTPANIIQQV